MAGETQFSKKTGNASLAMALIYTWYPSAMCIEMGREENLRGCLKLLSMAFELGTMSAGIPA